MKSKFLRGQHGYDGSPLNSLWAFREHNIQGDSIIAFQGACDVNVASLVDIEDAKAGAFIWSADMLHFIVENFELDLEAAILRQYLLVSIAQDEINRRQSKFEVRRSGNDLFVGKKKLSVSIATLTPVSSKIHFGINVVSKGTPVPTMGLKDLGINSKVFAETLLARFVDDHKRIGRARSKVRGVQ